MKKFTKGCLITALILFIIGCIICGVCGILGGFRQIASGTLNGIMGIPFGFYRQADGGWEFGFFDSDREKEEDAFWEKENWQQVDGKDKQKLNVTVDTLRELYLEVSDCNLVIEDSSDEYVWLLVNDGSRVYYKTEKDTVNKDILSVRNHRYHRIGNWRDRPNDTITLYLPKDCDLQMVSVYMGAGYMESVALKGNMMEINVGAGICEAKGFEADTVNLLVGAGQIKADRLKADTAIIEVGAGEMIVQDVAVKEHTEVELSLGNAEITGTMTGQIDAECNMGNLTMRFTGSEDDYEFDVDCDMGDAKIGSRHFSGVSISREWNSDRDNRLDIDCAMGNLEVSFEDE